MKIRNGYVSNSSSSSFVVLKDALSEKQIDMILAYQQWIDFFIGLNDWNDENFEGYKQEEIKNVFSYYDTDPWKIIDYADFIFGETSMDNFSMIDYFEFIKVPDNYVMWDDGYNYEPYPNQLEFVRKMKKEIRKNKINNINNNIE